MDYYYVDCKLIRSMNNWNALNSDKPQFTHIDATVLSIISSFESNPQKNKHCFLSNETLSEYLMTSVSSIKRSVNKLCETQLISKASKFSNGTKKRILYCDKTAIQEFINKWDTLLL